MLKSFGLFDYLHGSGKGDIYLVDQLASWLRECGDEIMLDVIPSQMTKKEEQQNGALKDKI